MRQFPDLVFRQCFLLGFLRMGLSWTSVGLAGITFLLVFTALIGSYYPTRLPIWLRRVWLPGILAVVAVSCIGAVGIMHRNVTSIPDWDFRVFWMYGQLAARGANVYDPAEFGQFEKAFQPSTAFVETVFNVGATYPPPTMFFFLPLGWFDVHTAYWIWYVIQAACLLFSAYLLRGLFLPDFGAWGLVLTAFLIFCLRSSWSTINFGQTNFLALLFLLLYWRDRGHPRSGLWLTLAVTVKLYALALLVDVLLHRRWRTLAWTVASSVVIWLGSLALLGPNTFYAYFSSPPTSRLPYWVYIEDVNQSLLAVILRSRDLWRVGGLPVRQPLFVVLASSLASATAWLGYRVKQHAAALALVMGLLLYPGTLAHYSLVLIIPLLEICVSRRRVPGKALGCATLVAVVYGLVAFNQGNAVFVAFLLTWLALAVASLSAASHQQLNAS